MIICAQRMDQELTEKAGGLTKKNCQLLQPFLAAVNEGKFSDNDSTL